MTTQIKLLALAQTIGLILAGILAAFGVRYIVDVYGADVIATGIQICGFLFAVYALYRLRLADLETKQSLKRLNETK
jgi:hypothetical protein